MIDYSAGFIQILKRIKENVEPNLKLTHKQIRAMARCLLVCRDEVWLSKRNDEVWILVLALSKNGLAHYDRSFLASQILQIIDEVNLERISKLSASNYDDELAGF